jgi:hypothetical protein
MTRGLAAVALVLAAATAASPAPDGIALGPRVELKHQAKGHEAHLSGAALAPRKGRSITSTSRA